MIGATAKRRGHSGDEGGLDDKSLILLLKNLENRLEKDYRLRTSLSSYEVDALREAIARLEGKPPDADAPARAQVATEASPSEAGNPKGPAGLPPRRPLAPPAPPLDTSALSLKAIQNPGVTVCFDFGTAMSKACAIDEATGKVLELRLGEIAGEPEAIYPVSSTLWFSSDGRIFLGPQAIEQSLMHEGGRKRFDSLKQQVSLGLDAQDLWKVRIPEGINPTEVPFSVGDLITIYLSYLTWLVGDALALRHGSLPYVRRRLAVPVWRREHWVALDQQLHEMLAAAQLVADTFDQGFREGIHVEHARAVLDEVKKLPSLPGLLIARPVLEPIAAGVSCISPDTKMRGLVMVVDCGAGTTDFALFVVRVSPDDEIYSAWHIKGCADAVNLAGDTLDEALRSLVLRRVGVTPAHAHFRLINDGLSRDLRRYKERIFRDGKVTITLVTESSFIVRLDELMDEPIVQDFQRAVRERVVRVLERADESFFQGLSGRPVTVCLTGGGADLNLLRELGQGTVEIRGRSVRLALGPRVPELYEQIGSES